MKSATAVLVAACLLGVFSDFLFNETLFKSVPWGLSLLVWLISLTFASLILTRHTKPTGQWKSLWLLVPPLFLAAGCAWRDSPVLRWLDIGMLWLFLCAASASMMGIHVRAAGIMQYFDALWKGTKDIFYRATPLLFKDVPWNDLMSEEVRTHGGAAFKGLLIALPLLAVFSVLFIRADAAFQTFVANSLDFDAESVCRHVFLTLISIWAIGGFFHGFLFDKQPEPIAVELGTEKKGWSLGPVEVGVVLSLMNLLFGAFVVVQTKYFFGGVSTISATSALTYSEYARRGFFELVTVVALVIPILLGLDWALKQASALSRVVIRSLTGLQICFLFAIMVSAVERMWLYQSEYGQTELRYYTTAFMGWLAIVCVTFLMTVLRGRRKTFAFASVISGFMVIVGLHVVNPDAVIVGTNIERAKEGKPFDAEYATLLSNDAIPTLLAGLPNLKPADQQFVIDRLKVGFNSSWKADWRSWNWSCREAYLAVSKKMSAEKLLSYGLQSEIGSHGRQK